MASLPPTQEQIKNAIEAMKNPRVAAQLRIMEFVDKELDRTHATLQASVSHGGPGLPHVEHIKELRDILWAHTFLLSRLAGINDGK